MDELTCVVCGNPATQKYLVIRSDVDPIYADVCDECAVNHTPQCIDSHLQLADYERDWPDYCRQCGGWGSHYYPGTYWEPPDASPCAACVEDGRCPRCAHQHNEDWDGEICEACGWNYDDCSGDILDVECECGIDWDDPETWDNEPFSYNDLPDHDC